VPERCCGGGGPTVAERNAPLLARHRHVGRREGQSVRHDAAGYLRSSVQSAVMATRFQCRRTSKRHLLPLHVDRARNSLARRATMPNRDLDYPTIGLRILGMSVCSTRMTGLTTGKRTGAAAQCRRARPRAGHPCLASVAGKAWMAGPSPAKTMKANVTVDGRSTKGRRVRGAMTASRCPQGQAIPAHKRGSDENWPVLPDSGSQTLDPIQ
jgi:hypothetical protein